MSEDKGNISSRNSTALIICSSLESCKKKELCSKKEKEAQRIKQAVHHDESSPLATTRTNVLKLSLKINSPNLFAALYFNEIIFSYFSFHFESVILICKVAVDKSGSGDSWVKTSELQYRWEK